MSLTRHCFALDLKDQPELIERYKQHHQPGQVWPEILDSIKGSGIENLDIYLTGNRLFMVMEVDHSFNMQAKAKADLANPKVQAWETLMWQFQQKLPWAEEGQKWIEMEAIFNLKEG